jgi:hypothetical protein
MSASSIRHAQSSRRRRPYHVLAKCNKSGNHAYLEILAQFHLVQSEELAETIDGNALLIRLLLRDILLARLDLCRP